MTPLGTVGLLDRFGGYGVGVLGDVLELAATSSTRWSTLRASVTQFCDADGQQRSIEKNQPPFVPKRSTPPGDPLRRSSELQQRTTIARFWASGLDRIRVEEAGPDDSTEVTLTVRNPTRRWTQGPSGEVLLDDLSGPFRAAPDFSGWSLLLDPGRLLEGADLEVLSPGEIAGRATLRVRVRPKGPAGMPAFGRQALFLGWLGDESVVELDAETGLVLHLESLVDGDVFRSFTLSNVEIDAPLDSALFDEGPPDGAPIRSTHQIAEPIESVAAKVPLTLFAPTGSSCNGFVRPSKDGAEPVVHVLEIPSPGVFRPGQVLTMIQLIESSSTDALADPTDWDTADVDGNAVRVWQPDGGGEVHVRLERQGTHIWLRGPNELDRAYDVVRSLAAVTPG